MTVNGCKRPIAAHRIQWNRTSIDGANGPQLAERFDGSRVDGIAELSGIHRGRSNAERTGRGCASERDMRTSPFAQCQIRAELLCPVMVGVQVTPALLYP